MKYKITYVDSGRPDEVVEAYRVRSAENDQWIDFTDGSDTLLLRVRSASVHRVELDKG